jgi:hypothetical protein
MMDERELFANWKHQSNSVNPWLAWQARAAIAEQRIRELESLIEDAQDILTTNMMDEGYEEWMRQARDALGQPR